MRCFTKVALKTKSTILLYIVLEHVRMNVYCWSVLNGGTGNELLIVHMPNSINQPNKHSSIECSTNVRSLNFFNFYVKFARINPIFNFHRFTPKHNIHVSWSQAISDCLCLSVLHVFHNRMQNQKKSNTSVNQEKSPPINSPNLSINQSTNQLYCTYKWCFGLMTWCPSIWLVALA